MCSSIIRLPYSFTLSAFSCLFIRHFRIKTDPFISNSIQLTLFFCRTNTFHILDDSKLMVDSSLCTSQAKLSKYISQIYEGWINTEPILNGQIRISETHPLFKAKRDNNNLSLLWECAVDQIPGIWLLISRVPYTSIVAHQIKEEMLVSTVSKLLCVLLK